MRSLHTYVSVFCDGILYGICVNRIRKQVKCVTYVI